MPRAAGQIDLAKSEAILDAAAEVLNERGMAAPIETIAKRAGVSKQTIYNHYGSKSELVRALTAKRFAKMIRPIEDDPEVTDVEGVLAQFALELLQTSFNPQSMSLLRIMVLASEDLLELSKQVFEAGPAAALTLTANYLQHADRQGLLRIGDPRFAAELFIGMVLGHRQLSQLLRLPSSLRPEDAEGVARETARRFVRAYAPD